MDFDFTTETITPDSTNVLTIAGTGGLEFPIGTTVERPSSPVNGTMRYNQDLGYFEAYVDNTWTDIVDGNSARWIKAETIIVQKTPGPGEFSSVAAAMNSITDSSSIKPYVIVVLAGAYDEPQIVMKEFVTIFGSGTNSTILNSTNTSADFIIACRNSGLSDLSINSTGASPGTSLIYFDEPNNDIQNSFITFNITFRNAYQFVKCLRGSIQISNGLIGGIHPFTRGFESINNTTGSRLVIRNLFSTRLSTPYPEFLIKVDGTNAFCVATNVFNRARGAGVPPSVPAGTGVWIRNGAQIRMQSASILGYDKGIWVENAGAAPQGNFNAVLLDVNVQDLVIEHPNSIGSFNGTLNGSTCIDDSNNYAILALDDDINGTRITGSLFIGQNLDTMTDVTDLIQKATAVGVLTGGDVTLGTNALEVDISAGTGYRSQAVDNISERFTWPDTTITLPDNQFNFIFINASNVITFSQARPDFLTNIILGVAYTRGGVIERLTPAKFDAIHADTKIDNYLRTVIGAVVLDGLLVTEGSSGLKLNISAGSVAFSILTFNSSAGTDIDFLPAYHSSGVWTYGTITDTVPVTQYDNLTNLTSLTTNYYTKHVLYVSEGDGTVKYYLVYGQAEYATEQEAIDGPLPIPPTQLTVDTVPVVALVVQEGATTISNYIDVRPRIRTEFQVTQGGGIGITDHGDLTGLADDDHTQYILVSGTRAFTGDVSLGSNNITNVNLINGVDIDTHGSRHDPNGADPIATATAVSLSPSSTNTAGTANSLARSDHTHLITGFQPVDADLTSIASLSSTGIGVRSATDTWTTRSLVPPAAGITITNPAGLAGNPTFALSNDLLALENLSTTGLSVRTGTDTWATRTIAGTTDRITVTNGTGVSANPTIDIASTYVGQSSITTLGTIATGTWNATTIAVNRGGTGLTSTPTNGQIDIGNGTGFTRTTLTAGTGITVTNGAGSISIAAINNGTVTSVGLSLPSIFSVSGSPVTSSGTLTGTLATQSANTFLAGPVSGGPATPTFRTVGIDELNDVVITSPTSTQILSYNGSNWINSSVQGANASGTIGVSPSGGGTAWTLISGSFYRADFVHNLGTTNVSVTLWDTSNNAIVTADSVVTTDNNTVRVTVIGNTKTLKVVVIANGQSIVAGGSTPSSVITAYEGVTISSAATRLNFRGQAVGVTDAGAGTTNITIGSRFTFFANSLDTPVNSDFAINAIAATVTDPTYASLNVRSFSNSVEQGVACLVSIPTGATTLTIKIRGRAQTAPGVASVVQPRLYTRLLPNNSVVGSWSSANELSNINIPTNSNFQYYTSTVTLSSLSLTAGNLYQFEITRRVAGVSGTNLASNFLLAELTLEFA